MAKMSNPVVFDSELIGKVQLSTVWSLKLSSFEPG